MYHSIPSVQNIYSFVLEISKKAPHRSSLITCSQNGTLCQDFSYADLAKNMTHALQYLHEIGIKRGDCIALAFTNSTDLLILSWAAWSMGATTVPLDTRNDIQEVYEYKIRTTQSRYLIIQKNLHENIKLPEIKSVSIKIFSHFSHKSSTLLPPLIHNPHHIALILFTSGTTGNPKGAQLSLQNLLTNADGVRQWLDIKSNDRFLVNLPLHHINSTTFCLSLLLSGGTIVVPPAYSNSNFWSQVEKTKITITSIVQSILYDQLSHKEEFEAKKQNILLNRIQIGSAPVIAQSALEFEDSFHIPLFQGYGQTETALRVTGVPISLSPKLHKKMVEENSIGTAMSWADVQILDKEGNQIQKENEEGELVVKGDAVMRGYIGKEPAFTDGYFLTGDIGYFQIIEKQKFFFLKGRKKEIIIKGGVNISPVAVENRLKKISSDIDQAYVIGVPDNRYGEEVAVLLCWKKNIDTHQAMENLKNILRSKNSFIGSYETPKYFFSLEEKKLPKTSTGKVQRILLKKQYPKEMFEHL